MTDNKDIENKKINKKLILGSGTSKLTLGKNIYTRKSGRSLASGGATVIVEVKRGKALCSGINIDNNLGANTSKDELQISRRLSVLKKAREGNETPIVKISTISEIEKTNHEKIEPDIPSYINTSNDDLLLDSENVLNKQNNDKNLEKEEETLREQEELEKKKLEEEKTVNIKQKSAEPRKIKKSDIFNMLSEDSNDLKFKTRSLASIKRAKAKEKRKNSNLDLFYKKQDKVYREVIVPEVITVSELSNRMAERFSDVIGELMKLGIIATANQSIDADTAELVINAFGHSVKRIQESDVENLLNREKDKPENLEPRAPVITVMGHVDHGKTSLLDALKSTNVVIGEAGGITQHMVASSVKISNNKMITFIDTPGHEAFSEMRIRGAKVTDIIVLVIAADDGIKTQTIEAINHTKAAQVPVIVAITKIDKPEANVEKVKNQLLNYGLIPEDLGGDTLVVPVSVKEKKNLDKLQEVILLVSEIEELKANPNTLASGIVIESKVNKVHGIVATVLVKRGTLKNSNLLVAGTAYGRIKKMTDSNGNTVLEAIPSYAVEILGLNALPLAGDTFNVVMTEKEARDITEYRIRKSKENKVTAFKTSLEDLFQKASGENKIKQFPLIIKGDVHGTTEAIIGSLNKVTSEEVKLKIVHQGVGAINESDIAISKATGSIILGFNVRANTAARIDAEKHKINIRYYSVIYNLIDDVKCIMSGMLSPVTSEVYLGSVKIREVFNVSKIGKVAGSYVIKGVIKKGANVRLIRNDIVIYEGKLKTLKRFKEDIKEVQEGFECGIAFENYADIKVNDWVEVFEIVEEQKRL